MAGNGEASAEHAQYAAPKMVFTVESEPTSAGARTGSISFSDGDGERTISTPTSAAYTCKGAPVHLTPDNVYRLPIEMVQVAYEHFLDYVPPAYLSAPFDFPRYIGLHRRASKANPAPVIVAGLRDSADVSDIIGNTDQYVACRSFRGVNKVSPSQFKALSLPRPPHVLLALSDEPIGTAFSQKRISKSLVRSELWLRDILSNSLALSRTNVFAALVGGRNLRARAEYSQLLASLIQEQPDSIRGVSVNLNALRDTDVSDSDTAPINLSDLLQASLSSLSSHNLVRYALCPDGPHEMLDLVENGFDVMLDDWSSMLSNFGVALDFQLHGGTTPEHLSSRELGLNLFDQSFAIDLTPLASPSLHSRLLEAFRSETLGDVPTRAYLHHLLHTHEMTAHVLLAMHNTCVMQLFMQDIRESIRQGTFDAVKTQFTATYSRQLQCLEAARKEHTKVNRERGKGRLKGIGQERRDDLPTESAIRTDTPDVERERMSFQDAASSQV